MEELVRGFILGENRDEVALIIQSHRWKDFRNELVRQVKDKEKKKYYYLITFTLKAKPSEEDEKKIEKYILSQMKRKALRISKADYVKEYTKEGVAHWHIAVEAGKYIAKNRFNYYIKQYGYIDISKTKIQSRSEMLNYINKTDKSIKIL